MIIASNPPIEIPLESMSGSQKWELFQVLSAELDVPQASSDTLPQWHFDVLEERERALASGEVELMELDDFLKAARELMP
jgi:hypothetical protein